MFTQTTPIELSRSHTEKKLTVDEGLLKTKDSTGEEGDYRG